VSDIDINDLLTAFDNPNHCYPQDLVAAIRLLVKQRDEARREILLWLGERCSRSELAQEIEKRGWDYLKEDGK
jgi:nucleoside-diphosphate-sugar epimerase